jgi:DNA-directed RNA polymerase specialized sigma24 family protein
MASAGLVTQLLQASSQGNRAAEAELIPLVYSELRRLAASYMRLERPDHTLQPTALVHEAYLRLVGQESNWQNRAHFLGVAAQQMRRILVDHARKHQAAKRGVRAVLGHWLFGYVHPYPDGNGRMARFLMNAMLASGGYPWTVIKVEDRTAYLTALDRASIDMDIGPFAKFIAERVAA